MRIHTANRKQQKQGIPYSRQRWDKIRRQTENKRLYYVALARRLGRDDMVRLMNAFAGWKTQYRARG